jgi:hypothetical protein
MPAGLAEEGSASEANLGQENMPTDNTATGTFGPIFTLHHEHRRLE